VRVFYGTGEVRSRHGPPDTNKQPTAGPEAPPLPPQGGRAGNKIDTFGIEFTFSFFADFLFWIL